MNKLKEDLNYWFRENSFGNDIVVFDTETNGFSPTNSVLSIAAIRLSYIDNNYVEVDRYQRFYYSVEEYNEKAIEVNGLTEEAVTEKRKNATYPKFFKDDIDSFEKFCSSTKLLAGHNISFDTKFVPFAQYKRKFCTMYSLKEIYCEKFNMNKVPKLMEAATCFDIELNKGKLHDSMYDVEITVKVLLAILKIFKE